MGWAKLQQHMVRWSAGNMATDVDCGPSPATVRKKLQRLFGSEGAPAVRAIGRPTPEICDAFWIKVVRHADLHGLEKAHAAELQQQMEAWCLNALGDSSLAMEFLRERLSKLRRPGPVQKPAD